MRLGLVHLNVVGVLRQRRIVLRLIGKGHGLVVVLMGILAGNLGLGLGTASIGRRIGGHWSR